MEIIRYKKRRIIIPIIAIIIISVIYLLMSSTEDIKRVEQHRATAAIVYEITSMSDGSWVAIQGPETYEEKQGATIMAAVNGNVHVGDYVTKNGVIVDKYGNPLQS